MEDLFPELNYLQSRAPAAAPAPATRPAARLPAPAAAAPVPDNGGTVLPEVVATQEPAPEAAPRDLFPELQMSSGPGVPTRLTVRPQSTTPPPEEPFVGPVDTDIGVPASFGIGAVNGASMNFGDEAIGFANAAIKNAGVMNAATRLAYEYFTGDREGPATKSYEEMRDKWREWSKAGERQHGTATLLGNVAGGVAVPLPGGALASSAPMLARAANAARQGAIVGGLSGVGEGENLDERAAKGAAGTTLGAVGGALLTPVIAGARKVGGWVWDHASGLYRAIRNPEEQALRIGTKAIQRGQERLGPYTVPIDDVPEIVSRGQPVMNIDLMGKEGRDLARWARNTPGGGEEVEIMRKALKDRYLGQGAREYDLLDSLTQERNNVSFQRIIEGARSENNPLYRTTYNDSRALLNARDAANTAAKRAGRTIPPQDMWQNTFMTRRLKELATAPDIKEAMGAVPRKEGNRTIIEGFREPRKTPFAFDEEGKLIRNGDEIPNLQAWDQVQRALHAKEIAARMSGDRDSARQSRLLREQLNDALDQIVPSFREARGAAWRNFNAENAYEAGANYTNAGSRPLRDRQLMERQIANMSQQDREMFRFGYAEDVLNKVRETSKTQNVPVRVFPSEGAEQRSRQVLGPEVSGRLEAFALVESIFERARLATEGGSNTTEQLLYAGLGGAGLYGAFIGLDPGAVVAGVGAAGGRQVHRIANARLAENLAKFLHSSDPNEYARGIALLAKNKPMLDNLQNWADKLFARGAGQRGTGAVGPSVTGRARSDEEQTVPGPQQ